jgi:hypothetical protein
MSTSLLIGLVGLYFAWKATQTPAAMAAAAQQQAAKSAGSGGGGGGEPSGTASAAAALQSLLASAANLANIQSNVTAYDAANPISTISSTSSGMIASIPVSTSQPPIFEVNPFASSQGDTSSSVDSGGDVDDDYTDDDSDGGDFE